MHHGPTDAAPAAQVALLRRLTPLALAIAGRFKRRLPPIVRWDDVVGAAMLGLWQTVTRHGALPEEELRAMACCRIKGAIIDELRRQDWLPRKHRNSDGAGKRAVVYIEDITEATRIAIAASRTGVNADLLADARRMSADPTTDDAIDAARARSALSRALSVLTDRKAWIVALQYGGEVKACDIARALRVTEPRILQIRRAALEKLRRELARQDVRAAAPS